MLKTKKQNITIKKIQFSKYFSAPSRALYIHSRAHINMQTQFTS